MSSVTRTLILDTDVSAFLDDHAKRCGVTPSVAASAILRRGLNEWTGAPEKSPAALAAEAHLARHASMGAPKEED